MYKKISVVINLHPGDAESYLVSDGYVYFPHSRLVDLFKESIVDSWKFFPAKIADKKIEIQFFNDDGSLWLPNPDVSNDFILADSDNLIKGRWTIIDRAIKLRLHKYWKHINEPISSFNDEITMDTIKERGRKYNQFRRESINMLSMVLVSYYLEYGE